MLCDLQIFSGKVYHPEPPHAQSLFLFPIVFGINNTIGQLNENIGAKMTSRSAKKFPVQIREAKRVKITLPRFSFLTAADFSKK